MFSLVTGANGFIGSHLTRYLIAQGERVRVLVRRQSDLRSIAGLPVEFAYADLRDSANLSSALEGVQRVFHVAADYRLWAKNPQEIYENNVTGTRNLLKASHLAGIERFVFTSTVGTLLSSNPQKVADEQTHLRLADMIGHYKRSKFLAEQAALDAARNGQPVVIVNPTAPLGPGDWKPTPTGRILLDFLNGQLPAYVDTGLNFVPVEDVAKGHWLAAEHGQAGARYILGGRNLTLKGMFELLSDLSGRPMSRVRLPYTVALLAALTDSFASSVLGRQPRIPLDGVRMARHKMFVDSPKAKRELGYQPGSLEAAMERAIHWYSENGYLKDRIRDRATRECAA